MADEEGENYAAHTEHEEDEKSEVYAHEEAVSVMGIGSRGLIWFAFYVVCWLLMGLSCLFGLPSDCRRPSTTQEVLIELPVLLAFAMGQTAIILLVIMSRFLQAVFCGILEGGRFCGSRVKVAFLGVVIAAGLVISAFNEVDDLAALRGSEDGSFTTLHSAIIIILLMILLAVLIYHFRLAWKNLPGAVLISGSNRDKAAPKSPPLNRFTEYFLASVMSIAWALVFGITTFEKGDQWEYHYILVAWVLSLIARFEDYVSIVWLALTTAVFLQGIGAYSLRFLSPWRFGEDEFEDS